MSAPTGAEDRPGHDLRARIHAGRADEAQDQGHGDDPEARARGLLAGMGRGVSAGVGAPDRWTGRLLRSARTGVMIGTLSAGVAAAGVVAGGPAWTGSGEDIDVRGDTAWSQAIGSLEAAYADRLTRVAPIIVDNDALTQMVSDGKAPTTSEAFRGWLDARLQQTGTLANTAHAMTVQSVAERMQRPVNQPTFYFGWRHGEGIDNGTVDIDIITTHHADWRERTAETAYTGGLAFSVTQTSQFWTRATSVHELEHAADNDQRDDAPRIQRWMREALSQALAPTREPAPGSHDALAEAHELSNDVYRREAYADVKSAMTSITDTGRTDVAELLSDLRALAPAHAAAQGKMPHGLSHFTSPAIDRMLEDYRAGTLDLSAAGTTEHRTRAQEQRLDAIARGYVASAFADYKQVDLARTQAQIRAEGVSPLAAAPDTLKAAGWPSRMTDAMARAVDSYQAHLECAPAAGKRYVPCQVKGLDDTAAQKLLPRDIAGVDRDLSQVDSTFDRQLSWTAALAPHTQPPTPRGHAADRPAPGTPALARALRAGPDAAPRTGFAADGRVQRAHDGPTTAAAPETGAGIKKRKRHAAER